MINLHDLPPLPDPELKGDEIDGFSEHQMREYGELCIKQATTKHICGELCKHSSDCAIHNAPAYPEGQCDCGA